MYERWSKQDEGYIFFLGGNLHNVSQFGLVNEAMLFPMSRVTILLEDLPPRYSYIGRAIPSGLY